MKHTGCGFAKKMRLAKIIANIGIFWIISVSQQIIHLPFHIHICFTEIPLLDILAIVILLFGGTFAAGTGLGGGGGK